MAPEHVHLIGIGGTGMTALAGLLHDSGCRVTGSDTELYPPTSTLIEAMKIPVSTGYDAGRLRPPPDLVVIGNAVRRGNPEAEEVLDRGLRHASMPQVVAERFIEGKHSIVVAGTHGKTTTSAMLAWVLDHAGRAPGFLVGGLPGNFDRPYRIARGSAFVIEGDEYDTAFFDKGPKFMHYRPDTAVIGTVEFDHADIYRDLVEVRKVFTWFTNIVPRRGLVVRHEDCQTTREVTAKALSRVEGYGIESGEWRAVDLQVDSEGMRFRILRPVGQFAKAFLPMFGEYNVRNALAVTAAAAEQGVSAGEIVAGLATFRGVSRRLEVRGDIDGITILDDFAHHPTAIAATLTAVRARFPGRRIWAVLEPRSWSLRRNVFQDRLAQAFEAADEIVIAEVYGAEAIPPAERLDPERLVAEIGARGGRARFLPGVDAIVAVLAEESCRGDAIVVLSNGAFGGIHDRLLEALESRRRRSM